MEAPNWQYLSSAFFVFNWTSFIEPANLIAHLWSVCVEMQFYVVLPFLLIIPSKHRITVLWVVIAAAPILRLVTDNYFAYPAVWNFTSSQVDAFAAGALLATLLNVSSPKLAATTRKINTIAGKLVLALLIGLFALANALLGPIIVFASALNTISYSFAVLLSASLLLVCISLKSENRVMAWLGKRSYGIYLFHWPLITIALTFGIGTIMSPPLVGVVILAITLGLAWISYKYYETPFLKKKQSKS